MDAALVPDEPAWPDVHIVEEQGESPLYYRLPKPIVGAGIRPSPKAIARLDDGGTDRATFAFGLDVHAVGRIGLGRGTHTIGLWPEAGYVFSGSDGHYLSLGIGPALQSGRPWLQPIPDGLSFGLVPHLLYGTRDDVRAWGVRTSAIGEVYFDDGNAWGLELAHQVTRANDVTVHELTFGISLTWLGQQWK